MHNFIRSFLSAIGIVIISLCLIIFPAVANDNSARGRVTHVLVSTPLSQKSGYPTIEQTVRIEIKGGRYKGKTSEIKFYASPLISGKSLLRVNDKIILAIDDSPQTLAKRAGVPQFYIVDIDRSEPLLWLVIGLCIAFVVCGGLAGIKGLIGSAVIIGAVLGIWLPLVLSGWDARISGLLVIGMALLLNLLIVEGKTRKSLAAGLGMLTAWIVVLIIANFVGGWGRMDGLIWSEERMLLLSLPKGVNYAHFVITCMLLGLSGVLLQIGLAISSMVEQDWKTHPDKNIWELLANVNNKYRTVIATGTQVLITAYLSILLPFILLLFGNQIDILRILNLDRVVFDSMRIMVSIIGLLLSIPVTAFAASWLYASTPRPKKKVTNNLTTEAQSSQRIQN